MTDVAQMQISPAISLFITFSSVKDSVPLRMSLPLVVSDRGEPTAFFYNPNIEKAFKPADGASPPVLFRSPWG
jgi:hypothetical protein